MIDRVLTVLFVEYVSGLAKDYAVLDDWADEEILSSCGGAYDPGEEIPEEERPKHIRAVGE